MTLFAAFTTHNFFEDVSVIGNLIDSALVLESNEVVAFNANDNSPDIEACKMIRQKFGQVDLAMINYNAAGPYPSCFNNFTEDEKIHENHKVLKKNFVYLIENLKILKPKMMLPFAGAYVIDGNFSYKNKYLGTTTWDECAKYLKKNLKIETNVIYLRENDKIDLVTSKRNRPYITIDTIEMGRYIREELINIKYDYENDSPPNIDTLKNNLQTAAGRMKEI